MSAPAAPPAVFPRDVQMQSLGSSSAPTCSCGKVFNLTVQQGATLSSKITLTITNKTTGVKSPVDVTGSTFQFTAKPHQEDGSIIDVIPRKNLDAARLEGVFEKLD